MIKRSSHLHATPRNVRFLLPTLLFLLSPLQTEGFRYLSPYLLEEVRYPHPAHRDKRVLSSVLHSYFNRLIILLRNVLAIGRICPRTRLESQGLPIKYSVLPFRAIYTNGDKLPSSLASNGCLRTRADCETVTVAFRRSMPASVLSLAFLSFSVSCRSFCISVSLLETSSLSPAFSFASLSTSFFAQKLIDAMLIRSRASDSILATSLSLLSYASRSLSAESSTPSRYSLAVNRVSNLPCSFSILGRSSSSVLCCRAISQHEEVIQHDGDGRRVAGVYGGTMLWL